MLTVTSTTDRSPSTGTGTSTGTPRARRIPEAPPPRRRHSPFDGLVDERPRGTRNDGRVGRVVRRLLGRMSPCHGTPTTVRSTLPT